MEPNNTSSIQIADLLSVGTIALQIQASQRDDALRELVSKIPELSGRADDQQRLFNALLDREQLHSTGIGDGIALPHARNALTGLLSKPVIVFGRQPSGIPFGSIDGNPAVLLFLLVAVNVSQHLHILSRISRLLRQPGLRKELLAAAKPAEVIECVRLYESNLKLPGRP